MDKTKKFINVLFNKKERDSKKIGDKPFFSEEGVFNTRKKAHISDSKETIEQKRWNILEWIKGNPNSTCYKISKGTNTNYSQIHQIIRELLFVRLISKTKVLGENGEIYTGYYIPELKGGDKNEN